MQSEQLIQKLVEQTGQIMGKVELLQTEDIQTLRWKPDPNSWNILECLEHLNLYGDYYLPAIEKAINSDSPKSEPYFKSGMLGGYFAKSMLPKEKLNKMKTFKDKNPLNASLDKSVITKLVNQQLKLIGLLNQSGKVSLNKVKIRISISKLIKLRLGDTLQFFINHNLRHLKQIERIQSQYKNALVVNK